MSDDRLTLLLPDLAALDAEAEALGRDAEPANRFLQALQTLEQAAARCRAASAVDPRDVEAVEQSFTIIAASYQGAARFLERHGLDAAPLLIWVRGKTLEGIALLRASVERAAIVAQCRGEQARGSLAVLRAKAQAYAENQDQQAAASPASDRQREPRLIVDLVRRTAVLDGQIYDITSEAALRWVKVLADHPGEWIASAELTRYDGELLNARTDRLRKALPKAISRLIESSPGAGSRIRL